MPSVYFHVRWPDRTETACYSPSTVIREYFRPGQTFENTVFLEQARLGLTTASERVRQKFGFACSSAMDQLQAIETMSDQFEEKSLIEIISVD
jgi:uncharacterized repeat protein (TIGR04042 family)